MSGPLTPVEVLLAKCQQVSEAIASHRQAISDLTAERDGMVAELRRLGLSERAVGRLLGISGPRVNQIMNPAGVSVVADERVPEGVAVMVSGPHTAVVPVPAKPRPRSAKTAAAAPRTVAPAAEGVPAVAFQEPAEPAPVRLRPPEGVPLDPTGQPCTHPKGRRSKGLCGSCGTNVGAS